MALLVAANDNNSINNESFLVHISHIAPILCMQGSTSVFLLGLGIIEGAFRQILHDEMAIIKKYALSMQIDLCGR